MMADGLISLTSVIHFGLLIMSCDHHVTKIFRRCGKKMQIESLFHNFPHHLQSPNPTVIIAKY